MLISCLSLTYCTMCFLLLEFHSNVQSGANIKAIWRGVKMILLSSCAYYLACPAAESRHGGLYVLLLFLIYLF